MPIHKAIIPQVTSFTDLGTGKDSATVRAISWLHISDIHLRASDAWSQDVVLKALCDRIRQQRVKGAEAPDFILATGDIAYSGKGTEYALATDFFDALVEASGVPKERIFCIPGNHDVDRERQKLSFQGARTSLRDQNTVDQLLAGGEDLESLLKRQEHFREFQKTYLTGQDRSWTEGELAYVSRLTIDGVRLAIIGFNSAWLANGGPEDHGKLVIGERQVRGATKLAQENDDPPHVILAMAHHPLHLLQEFDRRPIQSLIERTFQFFHCGHLHEPEAHTGGHVGNGCLTLAAGASYETDGVTGVHTFAPSSSPARVVARRYWIAM
jgi:predicted MPP superfamily phosphohydrolase